MAAPFREAVPEDQTVVAEPEEVLEQRRTHRRLPLPRHGPRTGGRLTGSDADVGVVVTGLCGAQKTRTPRGAW